MNFNLDFLPRTQLFMQYPPHDLKHLETFEIAKGSNLYVPQDFVFQHTLDKIYKNCQYLVLVMATNDGEEGKIGDLEYAYDLCRAAYTIPDIQELSQVLL